MQNASLYAYIGYLSDFYNKLICCFWFLCLFVLRYLHARLIRDQGFISTKAIALISINDKILLCRIFTGDAFRQDPSGSPGLVSVLYNLSQDPYERTDLSDDDDYAMTMQFNLLRDKRTLSTQINQWEGMDMTLIDWIIIHNSRCFSIPGWQ